MHFLTPEGRWEWIILGIWIAHFILFQFCNKPAKKFYGVCALTAEPPPHPAMRASVLLAGPPLIPPSVRTLWMTPIQLSQRGVDILLIKSYKLSLEKLSLHPSNEKKNSKWFHGYISLHVTVDSAGLKSEKFSNLDNTYKNDSKAQRELFPPSNIIPAVVTSKWAQNNRYFLFHLIS